MNKEFTEAFINNFLNIALYGLIVALMFTATVVLNYFMILRAISKEENNLIKDTPSSVLNTKHKKYR